MKIIISPSKTKKIKKLSNIKDFREPLFNNTINEIISSILDLGKDEIEKKFKLKDEQVEKVIKFYKNYEYEEFGHALNSYSGIAYKNINVEEFDIEDIEFAENYLVILSALYGILTPLTKLKEYRLDMTNSVFKTKSLYEIWKKKVNKYFEKEELIINLASKEYSKIINSENIYNFEFYNDVNGELRQISTNSKKMRGFTANYIIKNKILDIEKLKNIDLNGYKFNEEMSTDKKYLYIKK